MKLLSIMRHGKSSWDHLGIDDIDRPLLQKGKNRTQRICKYMLDKKLIPDCVMSSPALRAIETANIVIDELKLSLHSQLCKKFYPGRVNGIIDEIAEVTKSFNHLLILGHNPALTELVNELTSDFEIDWLPTSGMVTMEFDINGWQYILGSKGRCVHYVVPKELKK